MSALPLASARFSKLWIPFVNHLLDGDLCKNFFDFHIFSFFLVLNHDLSYTLILPTSQLQTQQPMTSQIRSHIECLAQTQHLCAHFIHVHKTGEKCSRTDGFNTIYWRFLRVVYFFWPPCRCRTNVKWQTVPDDRTSHTKCTVAEL